jgi:hypothetical protein
METNKKAVPEPRQQTAIAIDPTPAQPALPPASPAVPNSLRPDAIVATHLPTEARPAENPQQPLVVQPESPTLPSRTAQVPPAPSKPAPRPAGISEAELARLLARFAQHYASGNLEAFMALFDESARSEAGGKMQIRSDYADLFRSSLRRQIVIWDMDWQLNGNTAQGVGSFQAQVFGNGETAPRTDFGQIKLEVFKHGDVPLITIFKHAVRR